MKERLLEWIFERPEQAVLVTMQHTVMKASALLKDSFGGKTFRARFKAI